MNGKANVPNGSRIARSHVLTSTSCSIFTTRCITSQRVKLCTVYHVLGTKFDRMSCQLKIDQNCMLEALAFVSSLFFLSTELGVS